MFKNIYARAENLASVKVFNLRHMQFFEMVKNGNDQKLKSNTCLRSNLDAIAAYLKRYVQLPGEPEPSRQKLEKRSVARPYNEANPGYGDSDSEPGLNQRPTTRREAASKSKGWVGYGGQSLAVDPPDESGTGTGMVVPIIIGVAAVGIIYFMSK